MPGIGPLTALAAEAFAPPMKNFRSGRNFAAWLGQLEIADIGLALGLTHLPPAYATGPPNSRMQLSIIVIVNTLLKCLHCLRLPVLWLGHKPGLFALAEFNNLNLQR